MHVRPIFCLYAHGHTHTHTLVLVVAPLPNTGHVVSFTGKRSQTVCQNSRTGNSTGCDAASLGHPARNGTCGWRKYSPTHGLATPEWVGRTHTHTHTHTHTQLSSTDIDEQSGQIAKLPVVQGWFSYHSSKNILVQSQLMYLFACKK